MSKKIILVLFCAILFLGARFASAGVIINEVQIGGATATDEFIELYNSGDTSQDLTDWSIKRKTSSGTEYSLVSSSRLKDKSILANSYFLLAKESGYVGNITPDVLWPSSASYSLANDNTILLYNNTNVDSISKVGWGNASDCDGTCVSNPTDGNSLQLINGTWVAAVPTPGAINQTSSSTPPPDDNGGNSNPPPTSGGTTSTTTTTTPPEPKPKVIENPTMKAKIIASTLAFTGEPLEMQTKILGYSNENVILGRAFWNFGDGGSLMQVNNFEKFSHTYYYPGEYAVFLEYYSNSFSKIPEATSKIIIKVLPTTVTISKIGDAKDFFIELTNNASSDIDISNWVINANGKIFILPKNSVIMSKKQMTISGKITGFVLGDQYNLKLLSGTGELIFDYNSFPVNESAPETLVTKTNENSVQVENKVPTPANSNLQNAQEIPASDLVASPILSDINENKNSNKSYFFFWGFVVLLVVSGGAVYYIRRGKNVSKIRDDFKIIDE